MQAKHFQILIVGGGNAGLSVAAQLLLKDKSLNIAIVDPAEKHYYQPAWTLVGAGVYDIAKTEKNQADFIPAGATWLKQRVDSFQPEQNAVTCNDGQVLSYDYMVVCPGIQLDWQKVKGLKESLGANNVSCNYDFKSAPYTWEMIKNFKGGTAVFTNPTTPIKCGGAPHKIMYLAVDYWRKKGILDKCNIHYLSGAGVIFGVKEYAKTLEEVVKRGNINVHFGVNVVEVDGATGTVTFETKADAETIKNSTYAGCYGFNVNDSSEGVSKVSMHFDLCHAVPPQSAPEFIKSSPLRDNNSPLGYVEINKHTMQHVRFPNVFSLGDCTNAPCSKTGAAIRKQAPVVVENLLACMNNQKPAAEYDGYSACPIPTEYGKLMLAEFDYTNTPTMTFPIDQAKPNWLMWILKTKVLPWLYWNRILSGKA